MAERRVINGYIVERQDDGTLVTIGPAPGPDSTVVPSNPRQVQQQSFDNSLRVGGDSRDQVRTDIAQRGEGREVAKSQFDNAKDLRDEFAKMPDVQDYRQAIKAYSTALKTAENPAGDLNLIYAYAKIMDPNSVVREGEAAAVSGGDSIAGQLEAKLKKELGGDGTFRPEYRNQLRAELQTRVAELNTAYESQRERYTNYASSFGVDPKVVIGDHDGRRFHEDIKKYWTDQGYKVETEGRDAQGNQLPDGARVPQGGSYGPQGDYRNSLAGQSMSGVNEGIASTLGAPVDLMTMGMNLVPQGINAIANTNIPTIQNPVGGGQWFNDRMSDIGATYAPTDDRSLQMARRIGQSVGGAAVPLAAAPRTLGTALKGLGMAAGGGVGGAVANQAFPNNPVADFAGEVLGSGMTAGGLLGSGRRAAIRKSIEDVPDIPTLKEQASNLYNSAESRGVVAGPEQTTDLAKQLRDFLQKKGRITPDGQITEVYPKVREAVRLADGYAGMPMTPTQMQPVRSVIADGLTSQDGSERYLAKNMTGLFDEWADPLAPELAQARNVSSRYLNAEKLAQARELAGADASQFTGSGFENALRKRYRALDRNAITGKGRYGADLTAAIEKVSRGTPMSNFARSVGKFAPTGVVPSTLGGGAAAMAGNALGGPLLGATAGAITAGAGTLGRNIATKMGMRAADEAEAVARNGGALDVPPLIDPETQKAINAVIMAQQARLLEEERRKREQRQR